ncbi:COG1470 family protein, partial [Streptomyces purpurogeneiscleroticus]|uniref:COG1470 family protein n=1 Tax=Streptomyces purpurogeneiscleroticus TaxID=68259 RepID=UPI001CC12746
MSCRLRAVAAGAAALTAATLPCAPPSAAADGWRAAPAGAHARPYFYLEGAPGSVLNDRLALSNPTGRARTFTVTGNPGPGAGAWIVTAAKTVEVPARTRAEVPFTVTVPAGTAPGDHPAALRVRDQRGAERAVRVHLRVSGPTLAALAVENVSVADRGGAAVIRYDLANRGNTTLDPRVAVRADGLLGSALRRPAHRLPGDLPPGSRTTRTEIWPDPPALDSVDVQVTAAAAGGAHGTARATYTAVPWGAAV